MKRFAIELVLLTLLAGTGFLHAGSAPSRLHYQGVLRDAEGLPLDAELEMTFVFFDAAEGGNEILVDRHMAPDVVPVVGGLFGVELGDGTVSDGSADLPGDPYTSLDRVFRDFSQVWVEVVIGVETLSPRVPVLSSAYALNADHVDGKDGSELLDTSIAPQEKTGDLTLSGGLTLSSGSPAAGRVLTADAAGAASWQEAPGAVAGRVEALADLLQADVRRLAFDALRPLDCSGPQPAEVIFSIAGSPTGVVAGFSGTDGISEPYVYRVAIETLTPLDPATAIGQLAELSVERGLETARFQGTITEFGLAAVSGGTSTYVARIEPALSVLRRSSGYGIRQAQSVPDVVASVLGDSGLSASELLTGSYPSIEMLTQWKETDLDFVSRLMEEEGMHYHFQVGALQESMVLGDINAAFVTLPGSADYLGHLAPTLPGDETVSTFHAPTRRHSQTITVGGYDFFTAGTFFQSATLPGGVGELSEFEPAIPDASRASDRAVVGVDREEARSAEGSGTSNIPELRAGRHFTLSDTTGSGLGGGYLLVRVSHVLTREGSCWSYGNEFRVLPNGVSYRPPRRTPRPRVPGPSTAIVTGPLGETTHTDSFGRIKVRFSWDRDAPTDDASSAWVRVATPVGGTDAGSFVPEVGDEVLVDFIEGDPDRPVVLGSLYNGIDLPPVP